MRLEDWKNEMFLQKRSNLVPLVNTQVGRWDDFLHIQLEGGIEFACKHSMISSHLPDYGLRGDRHFFQNEKDIPKY